LRQSVNAFLFAYGALRHQGIKSIIEAVLNIVFSILLIKYTNLGVAAVLIGTFIVNIILNSWFEIYQVFKQGFKSTAKKFILYNWIHIVLSSAIILFVYFITLQIHISNGWIELIIKAFATVILDVVLILIIHGRNKYFKDSFNSILNLIRK
jgi:hydrogenase-4 membrane subunit HyfE